MKIKYIALFLLLALVGCQREEEMEIVNVTINNERIEPSYSSVSISCNINCNATINQVKVYISTTPDFSNAQTQLLTEQKKSTYTAKISGLANTTIYYVRYKISNNYSSFILDKTSQFKTIPYTTPTISTTPSSEITHNSAILGGKIVDNGGLTITNCGVVYSKSPNPTIENGTKVESKEKTESFTCTINDLDFTTSYYARAYAINEKGIAYGEEISLTTLSTSATMGDISAIEIGGTTATIQAELLTDGGASIEKLGICYNMSGEPTINDSIVLSSENKIGIFQCAIDNLSAATAYYVRAFATNANGTVYSDQISIRTETAIAVVVSAQATNVFYTSATVGGNVTYDGGASVTERGVCYSINANPTTANTKITSGSGLGQFTCNLTDLQDGVTYYARAYAINKKGVAYGEEVRFTTKTKTIATVATTPATKVSCTSATVGGNVTEDGGAEITECGVVYSTNQSPTTEDSKVASGSGLGQFTCNLTDLQDGTTYYVRAYAINAKGTAYGEEVSFTTMQLQEGEGIENGYVYVDLGLSVKWATMNVGASKAEDYGSYFAWGETTTKDTYNWSTYKYCNGSYDSLTKYCNKSSYGNNDFTDNKTQLELSDDAAHVNWGGSWRMPTDAEWTELREKCTWTWTTQNGVYGRKVTSKTNGNSIFLPAAGYRHVTSLSSAGSYGGYWSSSLGTDYPDYAWGVDFYSGYVYRDYYDRYDGQSVRPVCP